MPSTTPRDLPSPSAAPAAPAWDAADLFLRLYFRRAVHTAALGALVASAVGCIEVHEPAGDELDPQIPSSDPGASSGTPRYDAGARPLDAASPGSVGNAPRLDGGFDGSVDGSSDASSGPAPAPRSMGRSYSEILADPTWTAVPADAGPDRDAWTAPPCGTIGRAAMPLDLSRLGVTVDYASVRTTSARRYTSVEGEGGSACASARDQAACTSKLATIGESLLPEEEFRLCGVVCKSVQYAVTTLGDEIKIWRTPEELRALFGAVDSFSEAMAWLHVQGLGFISCDPKLTALRVLPDGYELRTWQPIGTCPPLYQEGYVTRVVTRDGMARVTGEEVVYSSPGCPIAGRRPPGLVPGCEAAAPSSVLAAYFARAAALEAASVPAFEALEAELRALGAPQPLLDKVRDAIADERDHAERVGRLAEHFGARPARAEVQAQPLRDRFALALDNVVEGCVRESFGALLATFQAARARDPHVRATLARIARDETRHAALAFQIHAWLVSSLDAEQRTALARARAAALETLREELQAPVDAELQERAGMPDARQVQVLFAHIQGLELTS